MSNLTLQEIMVGLTLVGMIITMINGARTMKQHADKTNPTVMKIEMDVQYIREVMDTQAANYAEVNRRIDGIISEQSMLRAAVTTLEGTVKIMQDTIKMNQDMIIKGRDAK